MQKASKIKTARALRACLQYVRRDAADADLSECLAHIDKAITTLDFVIAESELPGSRSSNPGDTTN